MNPTSKLHVCQELVSLAGASWLVHGTLELWYVLGRRLVNVESIASTQNCCIGMYMCDVSTAPEGDDVVCSRMWSCGLTLLRILQQLQQRADQTTGQSV